MYKSKKYYDGGYQVSCFYFSYNFCHHGSGGTAADFASSQEDSYIYPAKILK
jgi:hypothetical protein